ESPAGVRAAGGASERSRGAGASTAAATRHEGPEGPCLLHDRAAPEPEGPDDVRVVQRHEEEGLRRLGGRGEAGGDPPEPPRDRDRLDGRGEIPQLEIREVTRRW